MRRLPWLILLASLALGPGATAIAASAPQKRVLVLYSLRRDAELSIDGARALPRILEDGVPESIDLHSEYIDLARFPNAEYRAAFRDFLSLKYRPLRFDVVLAVLDNACQFVEEYRDTLFPDAPAVLLTLTPRPRHLPNSTVVLSLLDLARTVNFALALQPDTRHVFVVSGAAVRDKVYESLARTQLRPFETRLSLTYLSGLSSAELARRVATLPPHSIIYYLLVNQDGAGKTMHPLESVEALAAVANSPVYSWTDSAMEHGILGGSLIDVNGQVEALAERGLRVLRGERADAIPAAVPDLNVNQIDGRQMARWGITKAAIPSGTRMRFREPDLWERYRFEIVGATTLVFAQTALIAGLLVQRSRRRRAENNFRRSQDDLRGSYERIHDLGGRLLVAQDAERSRIARELHDDVSQQVAILSMNLDLLIRAGREGAHEESEEFAEAAQARVQTLAESVHALSHRLHPAKLRLIGLTAAVASLQRELSRPGMTITFTHEGVPATLPHDVGLCLFRVVQEALQNAVKHSGAREVSIVVRGAPDVLTLSVIDDGVGFDVNEAWGHGLGLISMSERLEPFGGTLRMKSAPGKGARLDVSVALTPPLHAVDSVEKGMQVS